MPNGIVSPFLICWNFCYASQCLSRARFAVQADFNKRFDAAQRNRQAEVDKILEANRMTEVWEELARLGSAVTDKTLFEPRANIEDIEDAVLNVKV